MKRLLKRMSNSTFALTVVYTIGHIVIATACNRVITGASMDLAAYDAIVEPMINGVWFFVLHKIYHYLTTQKKHEGEYSYGV